MTAYSPDDTAVNFLSDPLAEVDATPKRKKSKPAASDTPEPPGIVQPGKRELEALMDFINKKFGGEAIVSLTGPIKPVTVIPTGSLSLDLALGVGGIPVGRVTEIYGPESSGKTTICQHIVAEAQRLGGVAAYIDMEHALDPSYAVKCGVDLDKLLLSQPDTGEQALGIVEALVNSQQVAVIVVDSVATLVPKSEIDGEMGDAQMGKQARLMSQALRKLGPNLKQTALIFTNQLRMKIGVMFGNPETTTGGQALKFYTSVRLDVRRIQSLKDGQEVVGSRTRVRVTKNKVAPPFREAEFDIMFAQGISKMGDLLDIAAGMDVVIKRGAFFSYNDERIGQGRENAKNWLLAHPAVAADIYKQVMQQAKQLAAAGQSVVPVTAPSAEELADAE